MNYQTRTYAPKRDFVFCMNQLGGVGRGKSQFKVGGLNRPDGARSCTPKAYSNVRSASDENRALTSYNSTIDDKITFLKEYFRARLPNYTLCLVGEHEKIRSDLEGCPCMDGKILPTSGNHFLHLTNGTYVHADYMLSRRVRAVLVQAQSDALVEAAVRSVNGKCSEIIGRGCTRIELGVHTVGLVPNDVIDELQKCYYGTRLWNGLHVYSSTNWAPTGTCGLANSETGGGYCPNWPNAAAPAHAASYEAANSTQISQYTDGCYCYQSCCPAGTACLYGCKTYGGPDDSCTVMNTVPGDSSSTYATALANDVVWCTECPQGSWSTAGSGASNDITPCTLCAAGTYSTEPDWQKRTSTAICLTCREGTYSTEKGATNEGTCVPCIAGYYCTDGKATKCPKGSSNQWTQQSSCGSCGAGTYSANTGATSCTACPVGHKCPKDGTTAPTKCETNHIQSKTGQTSCKQCTGKKKYSNQARTKCQENKPN